MTLRDAFGVPMSCGDAQAVAHYDAALAKLLPMRNDPVAEADAATAIDPGLVMGHVLKGVLCVLGTDRSLLPDAHAALAAAQGVAGGATEREQGHIAALSAWVDGRLFDACALLWRLMLHGVDVGRRWQRIAEAWEPRIGDAWYAFNDSHAMMAFAGAGRDDLARRLLSVMERTARLDSDNGAMTRSVGLPVARALYAYAHGKYAAAVDLLAPIKAIAARVGGSHAQRDLLAQTLISAAERAGQSAMARALLHERLLLKPRSGLNQAWMARVTAPDRA